MKEKGLLIGLDTISILLSFVLIMFSLYIMEYGINNSIKFLFVGIFVISAILLYNSIMEIIEKR